MVPASRKARFGFNGLALSAASGALILMSAPAHAHLGGPHGSIETDRAHLRAKLHSGVAADHEVHSLTLPNGVTVKEFSHPGGEVFAVIWRGAGRPDLRQLLGEHFQTLQADNAPRIGPRTRRPMIVNRPDLIVRTGGHSGAFWGVAILPGSVPKGFSTDELK
jgi:hypothetical protein